MPLTKPNQQLRRDLKEAADELMMIALSYQEMEDKLAGYAEEVKAGRIKREAE
ncbi:hypothetical protein SB759_18435 [Pseudomonas sp. SIMBA_059]